MPTRFFVTEFSSHADRVELRTPATAEPGATVSLTLTAHALESADLNYAVVYLPVVSPVSLSNNEKIFSIQFSRLCCLSSLLVFLQESDLSLPSCSMAQVGASCSSVCTESSWSVSLAVSDSGRSVLAALQLVKGQGVLTLFHNPPSVGDVLLDPGQQQKHHHWEPKARVETGDTPFNVSAWAMGSSQPLWVRYSSSCCSSQAELLVWNTAGNMKRCYLSSSQQRQQGDHNAESSGAGLTEYVSFSIFFWTIFLLWSFVQ